MNLTRAHKQPRLHLPVPAGARWQLVMSGPNLHEAQVDAQVRIRVRALVTPTIEHMMWIEGIQLEDTPPGSKLKPVTVEAMTSAIGLPLVFAHHQIISVDGKVTEERAGAFYAILHNRAEVVVHLRGGATWQERSQTLMPFLLSGQIDWPEFEDDLLATQLGIAL